MFGDKRRPTATIAAEIDRIIGLNIQRARDDVRLGQHEVATLLGISVPQLARYEEGLERAPAAVLLELTRHLGCQLTDLFAGMPSLDGEEDFPMSPRAEDDLSEVEPVRAAAPPNPPAVSLPTPAAKDDATILAEIIRAFSDLKNPQLRGKLLGLLEVMG